MLLRCIFHWTMPLGVFVLLLALVALGSQWLADILDEATESLSRFAAKHVPIRKARKAAPSGQDAKEEGR